MTMVDSDFDFDAWITQNGLADVKGIFKRHKATMIAALNLKSKELHHLMTDKQLLTSYPTKIPLIMVGIQNVHEHQLRNAEPTPYIVVCEEEDVMIQRMKSNVEKLEGFEQEITASNQMFVNGLTNNKSKQIETARSKINKVFDDVCAALKAKQTSLLSQLQDMENQQVDIQETQSVLRESLDQLKSVREKLAATVEECQKMIRSSKDNKDETKKARKDKITACGQQATKDFDDTEKALTAKLSKFRSLMEKQIDGSSNVGFVSNDSLVQDMLAKIDKLGSIQSDVALNEELYEDISRLVEVSEVKPQRTIKTSASGNPGRTSTATSAAGTNKSAANAKPLNGKVTGSKIKTKNGKPPGTNQQGFCRFYGSAAGCPKGTSCQFSHANPNSIQLCRLYNRTFKAGCRFGIKCQFRHEIFKDSLATPKPTVCQLVTQRMVKQSVFDDGKERTTDGDEEEIATGGGGGDGTSTKAESVRAESVRAESVVSGRESRDSDMDSELILLD